MHLHYFKKIFAWLMLVLLQLGSIAQDSAAKASTSTTTTTTQEWYVQPWVWIVGGIVLIVILIALFSSGSKGRTDSVTVSKTVRRDAD